MTNSDTIAELLFEILSDAPDDKANLLFAALEDFKTKTHRSYDGVRKQAFSRKMVDAMEEARRYRQAH
jgi:hypothetical protein